MKNAPATFQRLVNQVLTGLDDFSAAYLDDIAMFSSTLEEHLQHLGRVLEALQKAGITIKLEKRCATPAAAAVNDASPHAARFPDTVLPDFNATSLGTENQRKACPDLRCPSGSTHRSLAGEKKRRTPTQPKKEQRTSLLSALHCKNEVKKKILETLWAIENTTFAYSMQGNLMK
ncbi:hypothetical protein NDU88_004725 [Pleurodeles waltl]|uniref:ribonuclease H n=1 Tax=Pleurodeles waltl TaxID=8319 RepID=A0AAV7M899_PLEWA|nr:hypothetical protein NDU88_004725 [Pleurodeles waltl]